jgi:hypothetical protein
MIHLPSRAHATVACADIFSIRFAREFCRQLVELLSVVDEFTSARLAIGMAGSTCSAPRIEMLF